MKSHYVPVILYPFLRMICTCAILGYSTYAAVSAPVHAISMHGTPQYEAGFSNFGYANPMAPSGGTMTYGYLGSFDSLNPFILKGVAPRGLRDGVIGNNVFESLMARSHDEAFSLYGLLAEWVDLPEDRSSITFKINNTARFSDGHPVTVEDVLFTIELLSSHGRPNYKRMFKQIISIEQPGPNQIKFNFKDGTDRELPFLLAMFPILPAHAIQPELFAKSGDYALIGSGPYTIGKVDLGQQLELNKNPDYWGRDLAVNAGFHNFDSIKISYYRDHGPMFEAFKKGLYDLNVESDPGRWKERYDFSAVKSGKVTLEAVLNGLPKGMNGFVFNTRREVFSDVRVRKALASLLNFKWINKNLYHGQYSRTGSYFQGSELSALGIPASKLEKNILQDHLETIDPAVLEGKYSPVSGSTKGDDRATFRDAIALLKQAGYEISDAKMINLKSGRELAFEFMVTNKDQERLALAFSRTLARIGVAVEVRSVESTQFWERRKTMDFDMLQMSWSASLSPGTEQNSRWRSNRRDIDGWFNQAGAANPAIDKSIDAMLAARTREDFVTATRALDRSLISGYYVVPLFHGPAQWIARKSSIKSPDKTSLYGYRPSTWWYQP